MNLKAWWTPRVGLLSPASVHPHRPEVCTYNFILAARAVFWHKPELPIAQTILPGRVSWGQGAPGPWLPGAPFTISPVPQQGPLQHGRKGQQETPKAGTSTGQRVFWFLWHGLKLLYATKGAWATKRGLSSSPKLPRRCGLTAGSFASAAQGWLSHPRTA